MRPDDAQLTSLAQRPARQQENVMAKGKDKGNKEVKKPKADKNAPKGAGSSYQQSKGGKK